MIIKNLNIPIFIRCGYDIIQALPEVLESENLIFKNAAIITSNFGYDLVNKFDIKKKFQKTIVINLNDSDDLSQIKSSIVEFRSELIVGLGGGTTIDIAKYISMESAIPLISIPTVLSNDGLASPISILKLNNENRSVGTTIPIGLLADFSILAESPLRFFWSGIGDLLSNISAILDWELANSKGLERIDFVAKDISFNSAMKLLLKNDIYESTKDIEFIQDLFSGLVMSGISMIITNSSRPASGAEHNISHALDRLLKEKAKLHGIQVGFSTILTLYLHEKTDLLNNLIKFYKKFKFPCDFQSLGIPENTFLEAVKLAPQIRDRYTILNEKTVTVEMIKELYHV